MTYRAIPSPNRRFSRVVRLVAAFDLAMAAILALPFASAALMDYLFRLDQLLGFQTPAVILLPSFTLALNLAGVMAAAWATSRLVVQEPLLARLDTWRRFVVAGLIVYYVLLRDQTPALLLFVLTEMAAAIWEGLAIRRFVRTTGG